MDNDKDLKVVPKLAEVKEFKKKEEKVLTLPDTLRQLADNIEKGMFGHLNGFVLVIDSVDYGITLIGSSSYAQVALMLQAALHANIEDYMYGEDEE